MSPETFRFNVGRLECIAVLDGHATYTASQYFANVPESVLEQALHDYGLTPEQIPSPYSGLVINTGAHQVLVDTGAGDFAPGFGRLLPNLRAKGIAPGDIDVVILTHGHPDHLGGNADSAGRPLFLNARYVLAQAEWDFWTSDASMAHPLHSRFVAFARKNLLPIESQLDLVSGEVEIVPGIWALPTPGHTPGHLALAIASGADELLYISDAALHPLHLAHPEWRSIFDLDPDQADTSKRMVFDRAAADRALVLAFHFPPFPSLGHVTPQGEGWQWEPSVVRQGVASVS